ncbi:hypothetical protein EGW08_008357 [Elysia chlorotica]|uniref:Integrase catalytic domain-containing protein n=1 Tax=Elysia chlorotica TaxID=188477 RepID=A0A3S1A6C8_ELYCH|nr:hypothetical protein EGW08_008357 [Elysia chlorotica]
MLRKLSAHAPNEWDKYLSAALFAYRQQSHSSLGFSPFFLLFGRAPRGPMAIFRESITRNRSSDETNLNYHYTIDLHNRIRDSCRIAQQNVATVASESRNRLEPKSQLKVFEPGDKVLVLLPDSSGKLSLSLKGPFEVVRKVNKVVYIINVNGKLNPYHVNLLRKYNVRDEERDLVSVQSVACIDASDSEDSATSYPTQPIEKNIVDGEDEFSACAAIISEEEGLEIGCEIETCSHSCSSSEVTINTELSDDQHRDIKQILDEFADILTSVPGHTKTVEHIIHLKSDEMYRTGCSVLDCRDLNLFRNGHPGAAGNNTITCRPRPLVSLDGARDVTHETLN